MRRLAWVHARPDLAASLGLFLVTGVIFAPPLLLGLTVSPVDLLSAAPPWRAVVPAEPAPNPALTDIAQVFHPWLVWSGARLREGTLPLWNPYAYTGVPFFANGQSALLFPLTLLAVVLPGAIAVTVIAWLKLYAIGLATYWFLRTLDLAPVPALVGAGTFMLSATVIGWLPWTFASTLIFLPALLAATERLRQAPGRWPLTGLALLVALDVLAGYPQGATYGLAVATAWMLARLPGTTPGFVLRWAAGVGLGLGVAAVQIVPFVEYVRESLVFAYRGQWTLPLYTPARTAVTFLLPYFYGTGAQSWGPWQFNIINGWIGVVPLALLPVAVVGAWRRTGGRIVLGLAAVTLALHYEAPGLAILSQLPGLSLGTNLRLMPFVAFALAVLTAFGVEWLSETRPPSARLRWAVPIWFGALVALGFLAVVADHARPAARAMSLSLTAQLAVALVALTLAAALVARALAGGVAPARVLTALAVLQLASLLPLATTYQSRADRAAFYPSTAALEYLRRQTGDFARVLMPGHLGLLYGLSEAHGYDGLTPRRIEEVTGPVGIGQAPQWGLLENTVALHGSEPLSGARLLISPVFDLVGIRYILLDRGAPAPRPDVTIVYDGPDARIYRSESALPRAFLVGRARCVEDREARRLIAARAVDFRREVLLADCAGPAPETAAPGPTAAARITAHGLHEVRVEASTDQPAILVLTDGWFPGWTARVDGAPARLWRADHAFRGVVLAPGRHVVDFRYAPTSLTIGLGISAASLVVTAILLWPLRR